MDELRCKQKGVVSLWHWSHLLEYKVLRAWRVFTNDKKRRASRYADAMCRHRAWLLGLGVRQWIRVSSERVAAGQAMDISRSYSHQRMCCLMLNRLVLTEEPRERKELSTYI